MFSRPYLFKITPSDDPEYVLAMVRQKDPSARIMPNSTLGSVLVACTEDGAKMAVLAGLEPHEQSWHAVERLRLDKVPIEELIARKQEIE